MNFKQKLLAGENLYGLTLTIGSPIIAELVGSLGFDWVWIEAEHPAMGLESILAQLQAIKSSGTCAIVRVDNNDQTMIKHVLDAGPDGIIIPSVNTREDAEKAMRFIKYPPLGERGIGLGRAQGYGLKLGNYIKTANDDLVTMFMIEHYIAVENIKDILKVEGIDGIIIGTLDLAGSMNLQNDLGNSAIEDEVQKVLAACKKANIPCGAFIGDPAQAKARIAQGFSFVTLGADVTLLIGAASSVLTVIKA